jgi:hypothetical protein
VEALAALHEGNYRRSDIKTGGKDIRFSCWAKKERSDRWPALELLRLRETFQY